MQVVTRPDSDQAYDTWVVERRGWNREEAARLAATRTPAEAAAERKRADEVAAKQEEAARAWTAHCRAQPEDGPCLSASERAARNVNQSLRPPPLPRAEPPVPKPSQNAEWRPGYWHWAGNDWIRSRGFGASPRRTCAPSAPTRRSRRPLRPPRQRPSRPRRRLNGCPASGNGRAAGGCGSRRLGSYRRRPTCAGSPGVDVSGRRVRVRARRLGQRGPPLNRPGRHGDRSSPRKSIGRFGGIIQGL